MILTEYKSICTKEVKQDSNYILCNYKLTQTHLWFESLNFFAEMFIDNHLYS